MQRTRADVLFGIQLLCALAGSSAQIWQMLTHGISGVNIAMSWGVLFSQVISLFLANHGHRSRPSRLTAQNLIVFWFWVVGWGLCTLVATYGLIRDPKQWDTNEWVTLSIIAIGLIVTGLLALQRGNGLNDLYVRVSMAVSLRSLPHFFTAAKIAVWGGSGWSPVFLIQGVISLVLRLSGTYYVLREMPEDKARRAGFYIEIGNFFAWGTVTLVWFIWFFSSKNATP